jgi:hypothetical protein
MAAGSLLKDRRSLAGLIFQVFVLDGLKKCRGGL